jgi:isoquinoline 1-oxidoreductase beta subunit
MTTRRAFLKETAGAGAGLVIAFQLDAGPLFAQAPPAKRPPNPFLAWIKVAKDGRVTLTVHKSEMGQGVLTSLAQILDVAWEAVGVEQAPTRPDLYDHGTGGSSSVRTSWQPLRQAAAAAREMLVGAAAERFKVDPAACRTEKGAVLHPPSGRRLGYGELVEAAAKRPLPDFEKLRLKDPKQFTIVGRSVPRSDVPGKVDGSGRFGLDVRVPGMLYAVIARCPTFGGKARRFDEAPARQVPGVRQVVAIDPVPGTHSAGGVAVVAESTWAAIKGREALSVEWDHGPHAAESSESLRRQFEEITSRACPVFRNEGDAPAALQSAAKRVEAVYELPFLAHATMEPLNCTVHVRPDGAEAWIATQGPQWALEVIAGVAKLPPEKVTVHTTLLGGGFGRRYHADFVAEAAQVSQAAGAPVQVVWTREDDIGRCFYRPAACHRLQAGLDAAGRPVAWLDRMSSTSIGRFWDPPDKAKPEASELGGAVNLPYAFPNLRVEYADARTGVPVMWWRSVEHSINGFVIESFLDEVAAAAGADPLAFRLSLLKPGTQVASPIDPEGTPLSVDRLRACFELAAAKAGWGGSLPAGRARGIAGHFSFDSYVAEVAEVSVGGGRLLVHRVVAAVDCGQVVNPDGVAAQVESAIAYGLSAALKGAITIKDGRAEQANFDGYDVLRIDEMPVVEVHTVRSDAPPTGIGEPGLPPLASAMANAVFAATGRRVRRLPIRPADLA